MKIIELLERKLAPPSKSQCAIKHLSNVRRSQCVARGFKNHDSEHTDGTGTQGVKGSGKSVKGRKIKSTKYGGTYKLYPGNHEE